MKRVIKERYCAVDTRFHSFGNYSTNNPQSTLKKMYYNFRGKRTEPQESLTEECIYDSKEELYDDVEKILTNTLDSTFEENIESDNFIVETITRVNLEV